MKSRFILWRLAPVVGVVSIAVAVGVYFIAPILTLVFLLSYILLCFLACFFPQMNFFGPVIRRGKTGEKKVALTFDDGPYPSITPQVLELLDRYNAKATFFVSGVNARKHPDLIAEILRRGHCIGNHSMNHDPLVMLKGYRKLRREVQQAHDVLREMGAPTRLFRPPVGIVNPGLFPILRSLGLICVTFSCRAYDAGNLRIKALAKKILTKVQGDDIVLLHDKPPRQKSDEAVLILEMEKIITGIGMKGLTIVPLSELIGQPLTRMKQWH